MRAKAWPILLSLLTAGIVLAAHGQVASPVAEWQIALDRQGFSPGCIDGRFGPQTRAALMAWQEANGLRVDGIMGPTTETSLTGTNTDWFVPYRLSEEDLANLAPLPPTWKEKSERESLPHETLRERLAERFHCTEQFLQTLNSGLQFDALGPGQTVVVPHVLVPRPAEKARVVRIKLARKVIVAYGEQDRILGFFPCSIGKDRERRPEGLLQVAALAPNPNFTWDPAVFAESPEAQTVRGKLIIPPGPNNPVGVYWIGLSRPGFGIHGTPRPEEIGKTESHGCFRLANWNVEALARMVEIGTPVVVEP